MSCRRRPVAETSRSLPVPELIQGNWTSLVILTYSAQLGFFETHLLRQLGRTPLRLVLADDRCLARTFNDAAQTGQCLSHANRSYLAAPVRNARASHAKAVLLTTKTDGRLLVGSGNLSLDGYATRGELWYVYAYTDSEPKHLPQFAAVRALLDGISDRGWLDPPAAELLQQVWAATPWLPVQTSAAASLRHNLDRPLIDTLARAVAWPVETLTVHAPFFDPDADALSVLLDRLRPRRLRLLLTSNTSLTVEAVRAAVSRPGLEVSFLHTTVTDAPNTFLHAKFVHAAGANHEVMLTGSANLSRSALLLSAAAGGNIELGVIETRPPGGFDAVYAPLALTPVADITDLDIRYRSEPDPKPDHDHPVLLWSEIGGRYLTLTYDRPVDTSALTLTGPDNQPLNPLSVHGNGGTVRVKLRAVDVERLAGGGRVEVGLTHKGEPVEPQPTWPYHTEALKARLQHASEKKLLAEAAALPRTDAELLELLRQLEQTLIFDAVTAWKTTRPNDPVPTGDDDGQPTIRWEDLDWEQLHRHPKYTGYHHLSRRSAHPTDVQIILSSIAEHLGDLGATPARTSVIDDRDSEGSEETELGKESWETAAEAGQDGDGEDETATESPRRLSVSTRTRMAYTRFVTRYTRAVRDPAFQEALGPTVAVQNAAIFNHLLRQLLKNDAVSPFRAIDAQLAVWTLLWGSDVQPGLLASLVGEDRAAADRTLAQTQIRRTMLGALSDLAEYDLGDLAAPVRLQVQHLILDPTFDLDASLVASAVANRAQTAALLANLRSLAAPSNDDDVTEAVLAPWHVPPNAAHWEQTLVHRPSPPGRTPWKDRVHVLQVTSPVVGLTAEEARTGLARLITHSELAGWGLDYFRIRFATGPDVCFWDATAGLGMCFVDGKEIEFRKIELPWPAWYEQLNAIRKAITGRRSKRNRQAS